MLNPNTARLTLSAAAVCVIGLISGCGGPEGAPSAGPLGTQQSPQVAGNTLNYTFVNNTPRPVSGSLRLTPSAADAFVSLLARQTLSGSTVISTPLTGYPQTYTLSALGQTRQPLSSTLCETAVTLTGETQVVSATVTYSWAQGKVTCQVQATVT